MEKVRLPLMLWLAGSCILQLPSVSLSRVPGQKSLAWERIVFQSTVSTGYMSLFSLLYMLSHFKVETSEDWWEMKPSVSKYRHTYGSAVHAKPPKPLSVMQYSASWESGPAPFTEPAMKELQRWRTKEKNPAETLLLILEGRHTQPSGVEMPWNEDRFCTGPPSAWSGLFTFFSAFRGEENHRALLPVPGKCGEG